MKNKFKILGIVFVLFIVFGCLFYLYTTKNANNVAFSYNEYPLVRNNVKLHLDRIEKVSKPANKNILLIHGVTYSSHEFDIDYKDYSLVRALAKDGYSVWRLDIAGFGRSQTVKDGFMPDSDYAAEDINSAVKKILQITGQDKIDLLGWSWGTVTTSRSAAKHPENLNKLVLYAPILSGIGECDASKPFHHNTWEHSVDDFQRDKKGNIDYSIIDPLLVELWASSCWHYDADESPNGGRRDICIDESNKLIDVSLLKIPTLVIYGDNDPYLNYKLLSSIHTQLPEGSEVQIIKGGSHAVFVEKPYHKDFQKLLINFLND